MSALGWKQITLRSGNNQIAHGLDSSDIFVIPMPSLEGWEDITMYAEPSSTTVFLNNSASEEKVLFVLFLGPHSIIGVAVADSYL